MKTVIKKSLLGSCAALALGWATSAAAQTSVAPPAAPAVGGGASPSTPATPQPRTGDRRSDAGQRAAAVNQDTSAGSTAAVSEVVVTAIRGSTLQRTPAAVTAFTDERRNLLGIETGRDVANLTPSVSLQGEYLTVRGVGRYEDPGQGIDPGVAVSVDGVYTSSPAYLNQPDFLTDRIEVLRGPQSVYGRNTIGGTVDVYSKRPTDDFHGDFRAGYTSLEDGYADAALSGPISDTLKFRGDYAYSNTQKGAEENVAPGKADPGTGTTRLIAGQLEWTPTDNFDLWARYQNFSSNLRSSYGVQTGLGTGTNLYSPYLTGTANDYFTNTYLGLAPNPQFGLPGDSNPALRNRDQIALDDPGHENLKNDHTFTINASYDFNWAKLKYIGGYSQYDYVATLDADGTDREYLTSPYGTQIPSYYQSNTLQQKKWYSNELSLTSSGASPLRWVAGLYQYSERYKTSFDVTDPLATYLSAPVLDSTTLAPAAPNPTDAFYSQLTRLRSESQAVYGRVDYDLTSHFTLTGDLRYNWEQRYGGNDFREIYDLYGFYGPYVPQVGVDVTPAVHDVETHRDFGNWSGKIQAEWRPDPSLIAYAEVARGFKSGGFNLEDFSVIPVVKSETLTDYEAGVKKTFGRTFLVDASAYYYDYSNLQVPVTEGVTSTNPVTGGAVTVFAPTLANAQRSRSIGFELESVWSPRENLHLTVVYSYQNDKFLDFHSQAAGASIEDPVSGMSYQNLKGNTVPQAPANKISLIPQYVVHFAPGNLSLSATYTWTDSQYFGVFNTPSYQAPSSYNLDLRAVYQPRASHWTLIGYVRNVTNSDQYIYFGPGQTEGYPVFPTQQSRYTLAEPRTGGAELQYRF